MGQTRCILGFLLTLFLCGCSEKSTPPERRVSRVLLVYFAADNNLAGNVQANLDGLVQGVAAAADADTRVVAYIDILGENPCLLDVTPSGQRELYRWPSPQNSASGETLAEVIALTRRFAPASRYGLVLWSHGVGWLPASAQNYLTRSVIREASPWPATKWFGQDVTASPTGYIDTGELAAAIPDGMFDYILFDACYMASVEVLYALRRKAGWIVSSPTEVVADGFPYGAILMDLTAAAPDLEAVCRSFYDYYAGHPNPRYRSASVSLVRTSELDALAEATAELYGAALEHDPAAFSAMDISRVQHLDRYRRHFIFDLDAIAGELERVGDVSAAETARWREQLARTVVWEAHTAAFFDLPLEVCCGLSGYVPVAAYPDLNLDYAALEWTARINK